MMRGRILVFSASLLFGFSNSWSQSNPPEVVYPTTQDQQALEQLFKDNSTAQQPQAAPSVAAPTSLPAATHEEPHPVAAATPPLPMGEGTPTKLPSPIRRGVGGEVPPTYKVWIWQENGDTLWRIAQKVYGDKDKWPLIYAANRDVIKDPNKIYPKQVLKIPPIDWQP